VSRIHALVIALGGRLFALDAGSMNGISVPTMDGPRRARAIDLALAEAVLIGTETRLCYEG
jgi:hypothetical protein